MNPLSEQFTLNPAVATQVVEGRVMFLTPDDYDVLTLNASGTFVWHALAAGSTGAQAAAQLAARYHIQLAQAEHDVIALVTQLLAKRVLMQKRNSAGTDEPPCES